jgi:hypothetical protein
MVTAQNLRLAFSMIAISTEPLELRIWDAICRQWTYRQFVYELVNDCS